MNAVAALIERMSAAGHDPYRMTLHQLFAFNPALAERRRHERAFEAIDTSLALRPGKEFAEHIRELFGIADPDVLDFEEMED